MSLVKNKYDKNNFNEKLSCSSVFIEISHYEEDKLLKTETFPMTHFLGSSEKEFKKISYN